MSLSADELKISMESATRGISTSAGDALSALGNAIGSYIMENAEINFSWNGIQPGTPPVTDPKVIATGKISGLSLKLTPSLATTQAAAMKHFSEELVTAMKSAQYNISETGFATTPQSMSTSLQIEKIDISVNANERDKALLQLATCIVTWVQAQVPTGIVIGSHGNFSAPAGAGGSVTAIS